MFPGLCNEEVPNPEHLLCPLCQGTTMTQEVGCWKVTPRAGWFLMCPHPLNRGGQSLRSHGFGEHCPSSCLLFSFPPLLLSFSPSSLPLSLFTSFLSSLLSLSPLPLSIPVLVPLSLLLFFQSCTWQSFQSCIVYLLLSAR